MKTQYDDNGRYWNLMRLIPLCYLLIMKVLIYVFNMKGGHTVIKMTNVKWMVG